MEAPDCDPAKLERTYSQFAVLNQMLSGWRRAWRTTLLPAARTAAAERGVAELIDVGCGGGDVARRLAWWAARDDVPLRVLAIDPDPRALAYARRRATPPSIRYRETTASRLAAEGARFDLVISNHVLHHLDEASLDEFFAASDRLARHAMLHADLRRSAWAIPAFAAFSLPLRRSFVREDGFRSIRRAWTPPELAPFLPADVQVRPVGAFHLSVVRERRL